MANVAETRPHTETPPATSRSGGRWRRRILASLVILVIGLGWLWFGVPPRVVDQPLKLIRGPDGQLVPAEEPDSATGLHMEAHATKLQAQDSLTSSWSSSNSATARFACERIAVFNESNHLLMARTGLLVASGLGALESVVEVHYYPAGCAPEPGTRAPDLVVTLELESIHDGWQLFGRSLDVSIVANAGRSRVPHGPVDRDRWRPPLTNAQWNGLLHHVSSTTGITSAAAEYAQEAAHISQQIVGALVKPLRETMAGNGVLPNLPDAFYPAYREPPEIPTLDGHELKLVSSYHGLMCYGDTFWKLSTDREPTEVVAEIAALMKARGWEGEPRPDSGLDMNKGAARVSVFQPSEHTSFRTRRVVSDIDEGTELNASPRTTLYVRYLDRMDSAAIQQAIAAGLSKNLAPETLLLFERHWSAEQRELVYRRIVEHPPKTAQGWLTLAEFYRGDDDERSWEALRRAYAFGWTLENPAKFEERVVDLAEKLGKKDAVRGDADVGLLRELGLVEISPDAEIPEFEFALGEPVHFFREAPGDGAVTLLSLRVVRDESGNFGLAHAVKKKSMRSWGTGDLLYVASFDGPYSAECIAEPLDGGKRFRLRVTVNP